jgi:integrase
LAGSAATAANFLTEIAGALPHLGGLRGGTIRAYAANLRSAHRDLGTPLDAGPNARVFEEVVDALLHRPDKSEPMTAKDESWELPQLIHHWDGQADNYDLPLEELRAKAICLVMASGLARPSDIARLDLDTLKTEERHLSVRVFRGKTNRAYSDAIVLPFLRRGAARCAAATLIAYLERTAEARTDMIVAPTEANPVFISLHRPYSALQPTTVSSIVRRVLADCDITSRPYSVRNRATTYALDAGIPAHVVQRSARWASVATMETHYSRPRLDGTVAHTLLAADPRRRHQ